MDLQVLVVTRNRTDFDILSSMNVMSNVIIANQMDGADGKINCGNNILITTSTKGVGINRNIALASATADICLLADDDMVYYDNFSDKIIHEFLRHPNADMIIFNVDVEKNGKRVTENFRTNKKTKKINLLNFQNYGAVRIAFRRENIIKNNLWFSIMFGGGCSYSHGEDSLFLREAIKKHLTIITSNITIGKTDIGNSSWFEGYTEKFFYDKGALIRAMFPRWYFLLCWFYYPIRFKKISGLAHLYISKLMLKGAREYIKKGENVN